MKKQLKKNIAFLLATVMCVGAMPTPAMAANGGIGVTSRGDQNTVPSSAIPALVHGNVPFATNGTRFVSPSYVAARNEAITRYQTPGNNVNRVEVGRENTTDAYQPWRYLRLDFSGTSGVSPWGSWLGGADDSGGGDGDSHSHLISPLNSTSNAIRVLLQNHPDLTIRVGDVVRHPQLGEWLWSQYPVIHTLSLGTPSNTTTAANRLLNFIDGVTNPTHTDAVNEAALLNAIPIGTSVANVDLREQLIADLETLNMNWAAGEIRHIDEQLAAGGPDTLNVTQITTWRTNLATVAGELLAVLNLTQVPGGLTTTSNPTIAQHQLVSDARLAAVDVVDRTTELLGAISAWEYDPVANPPTTVQTAVNTLIDTIAVTGALFATSPTATSLLPALQTAIDGFGGGDNRGEDTEPVTFVIPLALQGGSWLNDQGIAHNRPGTNNPIIPTGALNRHRGTGSWLQYAAANARLSSSETSATPPYNLLNNPGMPNSSVIGEDAGIQNQPDALVSFQRHNDSTATLYVTLNNAGVVYVPLPVQSTSAENNVVVQQTAAVSVYGVAHTGLGGSGLNNLTDANRAVNNRHLNLTVANGTVANAQTGQITNTTIPTQGAGRNTIDFNLRITELVPHHRFGEGRTLGEDRITFELVAPSGFSWGSNLTAIGINAANSLHLMPTNHNNVPNTFETGGNANAVEFFYIYRNPQGNILRFVERDVRAAGTYTTFANGRIDRAVSGSPQNARAALQLNNIRLIHNNATPSTTEAQIQIRNIPQGAPFTNVTQTGGGNVWDGSVQNPGNPVGRPPLPGEAPGETTTNNLFWPQYVASVTPQTGLVVGTVGPHDVTLARQGDVAELISGRLPLYGTSSNEVNWDDIAAARVRVYENIPLSLWGEHTIPFAVTEGITVERATLVRYAPGTTEHPTTFPDNLTVQDRTFANINQQQPIGNAGLTARINNNEIFLQNVSRGTNQNWRLSFAMDLYLNIPANFSGPIYLYFDPIAHPEVTEVTAVRIAYATPPVSIESDFTNIRVGYQFVNVGGFTITENVPGALLQDENLFLSLTDFVMPLPDIVMDASFNWSVTEGDLELSNPRLSFDGRQHVMGLQPNVEFTVNRSSSVASTIEFTNVTVRSLNNTPLSNVGYDLVVWGNAVNQNFNHYRATTESMVRGFARTPGTGHQSGQNNIIQDINARRGLNTATQAERSLFNSSSLISELYITMDGHATGAPIVNEVVTIAGSGAVTVGGQPFAFDPNEFGAPHVNSNGVAVLPARMALSILFGADPMDADLFVWDNVNSAFYVDPQGRNIRFQVNNTTMWVGGVAQQILSGEGATAFNTAAYVDINQNSRLFVPLRAIAEAVGFNVSWDAGTSTVTLTPLGYTAN